MRLPRLPSLRLLVLLLATAITLNIKSAHALADGTSLFGKPPLGDCLFLWRLIMDGQDTRTRWFDEQQLRVEEDLTWPGNANLYAPPVVQIPKFFSAGFCNWGLASYVRPMSRGFSASDITDWNSISRIAHTLLDRINETGEGGLRSIKSVTSTAPGLAIFVWESGAPFEERLNRYTDDPFSSPQFAAALAAGGMNDTKTTWATLNATEINNSTAMANSSEIDVGVEGGVDGSISSDVADGPDHDDDDGGITTLEDLRKFWAGRGQNLTWSGTSLPAVS